MSFLHKKMTALHARTVICHISYLCNLPMHHVRKVSTHPAKDRITMGRDTVGIARMARGKVSKNVALT